MNKVKSGKFPSSSDTVYFNKEDDAMINRMVKEIMRGKYDWSCWKDYLVMGRYDEGELDDVIVAKIVREIPND